MTETVSNNLLALLSHGMAQAVAGAAPSIVTIDDGARLLASGVIWSSDGVIVATSHGVERDDDLFVITGDGTRHPATLVGRDMDTDIAVLKVDATGLPALAPVGGDAPAVGSLAIALARPGDGTVAATLGLVSGRRETETDGSPEFIVYTDAVLYPGFSGGALLDAATGQLIGLLNRMYGRGLGVALGAPLVARVVSALVAHGKVPRGYLGVRTQLVSLPDAVRTGLNRAQERGLLLVGVAAGSPAEQGGLFLGDTLLAAGKTPLEDVDDLRRHLRAGEVTALQVLRGGAVQTVSVTVGAAKAG